MAQKSHEIKFTEYRDYIEYKIYEKIHFSLWHRAKDKIEKQLYLWEAKDVLKKNFKIPNKFRYQVLKNLKQHEFIDIKKHKILLLGSPKCIKYIRY